jgi:hypothetical protein
MLIEFIYLLTNELTLTKLESCSLSRRIGFADRARIIEFGFKVRGGSATISCGGVLSPKSAGFCPMIESG